MRLVQTSRAETRFLDLTPITGLVFLLMFFFLLSWSFVLQPGVEVRLPVTTFPTTSAPGKFVVTLKAAGRDETLLFFDEKSVTEEQFRSLLAEASQKHFGDWITLNADESVPQGRVQQVGGWIMERGFHLTIATQRPAATQAPSVSAP